MCDCPKPGTHSPVEMCPLLKALGQHVEVWNLHVMDGCLMDNHTISSQTQETLNVTKDGKQEEPS